MNRRQFVQAAVVAGVLPAVDENPFRGGEIDRIADLIQARSALTDFDNVFGPGRVVPLVAQQLACITALRAAHRADAGTLALLQSQYCDLFAWLHQDMRDFAAARHWLDRALEWAFAGNDRESVGFVLVRKSQLMAGRGEEAVVHGISAEHYASGDPRLTAVAAIHAAHGQVMIGDIYACHGLYDRARSLISQAADRPLDGWGWFCNQAYLEAHMANSLVVMRDDEAAVAAFRTAISSLSVDYRRDSGVYAARCAVPAARLGDVETVSSVVTHAMATAETNRP